MMRNHVEKSTQTIIDQITRDDVRANWKGDALPTGQSSTSNESRKQDRILREAVEAQREC